MSEEIQEPQEQVMDHVLEQVADQVQEEAHEEQQEEVEQKVTQVPLYELQKERKKRQEMEYEIQRLREIQAQKAVEEDETQYESVTRKDLGQSKQEIMREVEENIWRKSNPERFSYVDENLKEFLNKRPNLATAIMQSENRYEEAWELMNALSPKQKQQLRAAPAKKETPGSPSAVPKAAGINQTMDVMEMSDSEFRSWRSAQKRAR